MGLAGFLRQGRLVCMPEQDTAETPLNRAFPDLPAGRVIEKFLDRFNAQFPEMHHLAYALKQPDLMLRVNPVSSAALGVHQAVPFIDAQRLGR